jgi:hypothetical protein
LELADYKHSVGQAVTLDIHAKGECAVVRRGFVSKMSSQDLIGSWNIRLDTASPALGGTPDDGVSAEK